MLNLFSNGVKLHLLLFLASNFAERGNKKRNKSINSSKLMKANALTTIVLPFSQRKEYGFDFVVLVTANLLLLILHFAVRIILSIQDSFIYLDEMARVLSVLFMILGPAYFLVADFFRSDMSIKKKVGGVFIVVCITLFFLKMFVF